MKNKEKPNTESVFRKKGFYVALYASLGVMVVLAAVISMRSFEMAGRGESAAPQDTNELGQYSEANQSSVESYRSPRYQEQAESSQDDVQVRMGNPNATARPEASQAPADKPTTQPTEQAPEQAPEKQSERTVPKETNTPATEKEQPVAESTEKPVEPVKDKPMADAPPDNSDNVVDESENYGYASDELGEPVFKPFVEENGMEWPLLGEIVLGYSMDRTIYDLTLDQYRTNDNICISAPAGTPVKASAEGVVTKIENTRTNGNTIVIDNGNGWTTTYSQLQDGVLVKVGDIVKSGQVLGGVGNPSIYGVLLGNHLNFKITKDDRMVDPISVLTR